MKSSWAKTPMRAAVHNVFALLKARSGAVGRLIMVAAMVGGGLLVTGCANVKPWQRGTLSDLTMRADRDPIGTAFDEHVYFSREAASGGRGVGGGGCGCN